MYYGVRTFPFAARVVYRAGVSGDDFWQVAKTGGGSAGVHFGKQPTQVFGRPCRSTQRVIALRRNFWLERLTEEKECRKWYETRPPGWEYSLSWTLSVQTCCLEPVLNIRAQACSEAFWVKSSQVVFINTLVSQLQYACPAWWGYVKADERNRLQSIVSKATILWIRLIRFSSALLQHSWRIKRGRRWTALFLVKI